MVKELFYLAIPYTGREALSYKVSSRVAGKLMEGGVLVFSPITHSHAIVEESNLDPHDCDLWLDLDLRILRHCDRLVVVTLPGWEQSQGVQIEMDEAQRRGIPISFVPPDMVTRAEVTD